MESSSRETTGPRSEKASRGSPASQRAQRGRCPGLWGAGVPPQSRDLGSRQASLPRKHTDGFSGPVLHFHGNDDQVSPPPWEVRGARTWFRNENPSISRNGASAELWAGVWPDCELPPPALGTVDDCRVRTALRAGQGTRTSVGPTGTTRGGALGSHRGDVPPAPWPPSSPPQAVPSHWRPVPPGPTQLPPGHHPASRPCCRFLCSPSRLPLCMLRDGAFEPSLAWFPRAPHSPAPVPLDQADHPSSREHRPSPPPALPCGSFICRHLGRVLGCPAPTRTPAPWREPPGPGLASSVQPPGAVGDVSRMQEPRVHGPREQGCFLSPHPRFSHAESSPLRILELVHKGWLFPSWSRVSALYQQDPTLGDGVSCPRLFPGRASWGHSHTSAMWAWTGRGSAPAWPCLPGGCARAWNHTRAVPRMLSVSLRGSLQTLLSSPRPSPPAGGPSPGPGQEMGVCCSVPRHGRELSPRTEAARPDPQVSETESTSMHTSRARGPRPPSVSLRAPWPLQDAHLCWALSKAFHT